MPDLIIPCLTLWQPYASAMAEGLKRIETRAYPAGRLGLQPGQLVAVLAAKRPLTEEDCKRLWEDCGIVTGEMPYGAVLSIHRLGYSYQTRLLKLHRERYDVTIQEEMFGDYSDGRYGWLMPLVLKLPLPIPHRGQQGIGWWTVPEDVARLLEKAPQPGQMRFDL